MLEKFQLQGQLITQTQILGGQANDRRVSDMAGDPYPATRKIRNHAGSDFMASVKRH